MHAESRADRGPPLPSLGLGRQDGWWIRVLRRIRGVSHLSHLSRGELPEQR
jgi:hypothetical protein